jgi:hypothetical protein
MLTYADVCIQKTVSASRRPSQASVHLSSEVEGEEHASDVVSGLIINGF